MNYSLLIFSLLLAFPAHSFDGSMCGKINQQLVSQWNTDQSIVIDGRPYMLIYGGKRFALNHREFERAEPNPRGTSSPDMTPCIFHFTDGSRENVVIAIDSTKDEKSIRLNREFLQRRAEMKAFDDNHEAICGGITRKNLSNRKMSFAGKNYALSYEEELPGGKISEHFMLYELPSNIGGYMCKVMIGSSELNVLVKEVK